MGCRPSKNAKGKVRDLKFKHKVSKKNWTNFDLIPKGAEDCHLSGFSDGITSCDVKSKRIGDTKNKKVAFSKFSTTSKTYHNLDSKVATITLRLSTDGSTLQVEKVEIEIDLPTTTDERISPVPNHLKRSESAPELPNTTSEYFSKRSGKFLKSKLQKMTADFFSNRPSDILKPEHLVVLVHQEALGIDKILEGSNVPNINTDKNTNLAGNTEESLSINSGHEDFKEIMNSFNHECNVRPEVGEENSFVEKQSLLSSSLSSSSEFSLYGHHALIQKEDEIGKTDDSKNISGFPLYVQNALIHKHNGIGDRTSYLEKSINQTEKDSLINKSLIQFSDHNSNEQSCCTKFKNDKGFHNLINGFKALDRYDLSDELINKSSQKCTCLSPAQSFYTRNNILLKQPFRDERNFNPTNIAHTVHDKMDFINCKGEKCNQDLIKHALEDNGGRKAITFEKSHSENCEDLSSQQLPPLASFYDDFNNGMTLIYF